MLKILKLGKIYCTFNRLLKQSIFLNEMAFPDINFHFTNQHALNTHIPTRIFMGYRRFGLSDRR